LIYLWFHSSLQTSYYVCGAFFKGLSILSYTPVSTFLISSLIFLRANMYLSNSPLHNKYYIDFYLSSDSVGSIINVPATGKDIVGAWNP
jgi:hypothetical protein